MTPPTAGLIVALDGPASSGKSSVGAAAATELGYRFCDTGLLYRAATWLALRRGVGPADSTALASLSTEIHLGPDPDGRLAHVMVDDEDVTSHVREPAVEAHVSAISRVPELRAALLGRQRDIARLGRIIMAGRDIGTVVLPDADLKLYLNASVEERARRRAEERGLDAAHPDAEAVLTDLRRRDRIDSTRAVAPLRIPEDAVVLTTDGNRFDQTVELVVAEIRKAEARAQVGEATRAGTIR
jgi:cytidylate kinase